MNVLATSSNRNKIMTEALCMDKLALSIDYEIEYKISDTEGRASSKISSRNFATASALTD